LKVLLESEIFRQAWWVPGDPEQYRPKRVLTLETKDSEALLKWPPVANTLGEFIDLYEKMGQMVKERIRNKIATEDTEVHRDKKIKYSL
jgi:hypothetical protein